MNGVSLWIVRSSNCCAINLIDDENNGNDADNDHNVDDENDDGDKRQRHSRGLKE